METKVYSVSDVKQRLREYKEMERYVDSLIERLERLESTLSGIGSPVMSDMPKSHNSSPDRFTDKIHKKDELTKKVKDRIKKRDDERHYIEMLLSKLKKANEISVIEMRYFDLMDWEDVNEALYGQEKDFLEREDTFRRRMFYIHSEALRHLAVLMTKYPN